MGAVFQFRMRKGRSIGAQAGFADAFNRVLDILENIKGLGGVELRKNGVDWRVVVMDDTATPPAAPEIPDISVASPADGGTASGTFDVLTGLAVDGTDKHQLNPTKKSVTLPTVSGYTGTLTVIVGWETVADGTTDRMKLKTREFTFASGLLSSIGDEVSTQWFVATPHVAEHPGGL